MMIVVTDLMTREELDDKKLLFMRRSRRAIFDSLVSLSLHMPHKIGTMVHELIETVRILFYIDNGLLEVVQHMMQRR